MLGLALLLRFDCVFNTFDVRIINMIVFLGIVLILSCTLFLD
jgi:hypothetical protein